MDILSEAEKRKIISSTNTSWADLQKLLAQALMDWVEPEAEEGYGEEEINQEFMDWAEGWIMYDQPPTS